MHILAPSSVTAAQLLEVGCELLQDCLCTSEKCFWPTYNGHGSCTASGGGCPTPCKRTLSRGLWHVYRFAVRAREACMGTSAAEGFSGTWRWPHSLCRKQGNHGLRGLTASQSWCLVQAIRQREPTWSRYTGGLQVLSALKVSTLRGIIYSLACYSAARQGLDPPQPGSRMRLWISEGPHILECCVTLQPLLFFHWCLFLWTTACALLRNTYKYPIPPPNW